MPFINTERKRGGENKKDEGVLLVWWLKWEEKVEVILKMGGQGLLLMMLSCSPDLPKQTFHSLHRSLICLGMSRDLKTNILKSSVTPIQCSEEDLEIISNELSCKV